MKSVGLALLFWSSAGFAVAQPYTYTQYAAAPLLTVPLYGAGYAPAQPPAAQQGGDDRLKRIEEKLDRLLKLLEEGAEEPAADAKDAAKPSAALVNAATKCYACHSPAAAPDKGGKFVIFDDKGAIRTNLSTRDLRKIQTEVGEGTMPPPDSGQRLSGDEKSELFKFFKGMGQTQAAPKKEE